MSDALMRCPQEALRRDPSILLEVIADSARKIRERHLRPGTPYFDSVHKGQKPLAVVSKCADPRQTTRILTSEAEILKGDVEDPLRLTFGPERFFPSLSIAGFLHDYPEDSALWAKIFYAVKTLGAPIILKVGHTECGGAEALVKNFWQEAKQEIAAPARSPLELDPTHLWLQAASSLTQRIIKANPGLDQKTVSRHLEEALVPDGITKIQRFLDLMVANGHLKPERRPAVVGLLYDLKAARLNYLQPDGSYSLLTDALRPRPHHHEGDCNIGCGCGAAA